MSSDRSDWFCSSCGKYSEPSSLDYENGKCGACQDSHLHPEILRRIEEQKKRGGIELDKLEPGTTIEAQTHNTLYKITVLSKDKVMIEGGRYFPQPKETWIGGSTWGGSMIKHAWLGINMCIEMGHPDPDKRALTTSAVESLKVIAPNGTWEYTI